MNIIAQFEKHLESANQPKSIVGMNKFQRIMALKEWGQWPLWVLVAGFFGLIFLALAFGVGAELSVAIGAGVFAPLFVYGFKQEQKTINDHDINPDRHNKILQKINTLSKDPEYVSLAKTYFEVLQKDKTNMFWSEFESVFEKYEKQASSQSVVNEILVNIECIDIDETNEINTRSSHQSLKI